MTYRIVLMGVAITTVLVVGSLGAGSEREDTEAQASPEQYFKARGEGRKFGADGAENWVKADIPASQDQQRSFAVVESLLPPGWAGPPKHYHLKFDEFWYVLEGSIEFDIGDQRIRASAGESVYAPRGTPHHVRGPGTEPARMLTAMSARQLVAVEDFFKGSKDPEKMRELLLKHETVLVSE